VGIIGRGMPRYFILKNTTFATPGIRFRRDTLLPQGLAAST